MALEKQENKPVWEDIEIPESVLSRITILEDVPEETQKETVIPQDSEKTVKEEAKKEFVPPVFPMHPDSSLSSDNLATTDTKSDIDVEKQERAEHDKPIFQCLSREEILKYRKASLDIVKGLHPILELKLNDKSIDESVKKLKQAEAISLLQNTSVDMLNFRKAGIRVSALKNHGIYNIYSVLEYDYYDLMMIPGIGEKSARLILKESRVLQNMTFQQAKVRPSPSTTSKEEQLLLKNTYKYLELQRLKDSAISKYFGIYGEFNNLLQDTKVADSAARWNLLSAYKKYEISIKAEKLRDLLSSDLVISMSNLFASYQSICNANYLVIKDDYVNNRDRYYGIFEKTFGQDLPDDTTSINSIPENMNIGCLWCIVIIIVIICMILII